MKTELLPALFWQDASAYWGVLRSLENSFPPEWGEAPFRELSPEVKRAAMAHVSDLLSCGLAVLHMRLIRPGGVQDLKEALLQRTQLLMNRVVPGPPVGLMPLELIERRAPFQHPAPDWVLVMKPLSEWLSRVSGQELRLWVHTRAGIPLLDPEGAWPSEGCRSLSARAVRTSQNTSGAWDDFAWGSWPRWAGPDPNPGYAVWSLGERYLLQRERGWGESPAPLPSPPEVAEAAEAPPLDLEL